MPSADGLQNAPSSAFIGSMGEAATTPLGHAIPDAGTTVAVFIGNAVAGPVNQPEYISGFPAFEQKFGGLTANRELGYAIRQFFLNGDVRCDNTTTTPRDVAFGIVNIEIGFAPLKPAEFVIIRLQQKAQPPSA